MCHLCAWCRWDFQHLSTSGILFGLRKLALTRLVLTSSTLSAYFYLSITAIKYLNCTECFQMGEKKLHVYLASGEIFTKGLKVSCKYSSAFGEGKHTVSYRLAV
ncbi:rCG56734 [Rattus norvegicus]|uniref:RCG56734 n=1 Tax=Rattus norvegicus TaxID=10116 RepID=A6KJH8_RAT|nr:rCG56734 [Rattus norvegicus]